jgi:hypothetical protein
MMKILVLLLCLCSSLSTELRPPHCLCPLCHSSNTVGFEYKGFCYYLNADDRLYSNNDNVDQFEMAHVGEDIDLADGLIALIGMEFYARFGHRAVNVQAAYSSRFFKKSKSTNSRCLKLIIPTNSLFDDTAQCTPEPSIIRTADYRYVVDVPTTESYGESSPCPHKEDETVVDARCLFFANVDDTETCTVAAIEDMATYLAFERLVIERSSNETSRTCGEWGDCYMKSFNKAYQSFIIHLSVYIPPRTKTRFIRIGEHPGYYLVDVIRKRLIRAKSYNRGIATLLNGYGSVDGKHLCLESNARRHIGSTASRLTRMETSTHSTTSIEPQAAGAVVLATSRASLPIFIVTAAVVLVGALVIFLYLACRSRSAASDEDVY